MVASLSEVTDIPYTSISVFMAVISLVLLTRKACNRLAKTVILKIKYFDDQTTNRIFPIIRTIECSGVFTVLNVFSSVESENDIIIGDTNR